MNGLFITSTGTEIGKTFVTASLCHQLKTSSKPVHAIKAIISGIENDMTGTDTAVIAESLGLEPTEATWNAISPFRYKAPLAPSMAAKLEGKTLDYDALITFCQKQLDENPFTLVEGVGGSFVPLNDEKLVANWIADLQLDSILVAGSYLGTLSHITATLEAMQTRNLPVKAIVVSETAGDGHPDFHSTIEQVEKWSGLPVIALPRILSPDLWRASPDMLAPLGL